MNILIAGSSGLVGEAVVRELRIQGHAVTRMVRRKGASDGIFWDPESGWLPEDALAAADAVINLCGAGIAQKRWSAERKRHLCSSRLEPTRAIVRALAKSSDQGRPYPRILLSASAVGFYGNQGSRQVDESTGWGGGFLAELCRDWEAEASAASAWGVRVVRLRFGVVLSGKGGMLRQLAPFFRVGLGVRLGDGFQWMSWIELRDAVGAILFAIRDARVEGPVNIVAPAATTNAEFTRVLGARFGRQLLVGIPASLLRCVCGSMADEMLLTSIRAVPSKLIEAAYPYRFSNLDDALYQALAVKKSPA